MQVGGTNVSPLPNTRSEIMEWIAVGGMICGAIGIGRLIEILKRGR